MSNACGIIEVQTPEWSIAIPSYKRHDTLCEKTMSFLLKQLIPMHRVFVFVADENESRIYADCLESATNLKWVVAPSFTQELHSEPHPKIVIGEVGISQQRRHISSYFPYGHHIIQMDDDVEGINILCSTGSISNASQRICKLWQGEWVDIIEDAGVRMLQTGANIWSISLSHVPWHLRAVGISTCFGICVGHCFGVINRKRDDLETEFGSCGDDVERSIRYMLEDHIILRYGMLHAITKFRSGPGGINSEVMNRRKAEEETVRKMALKWPSIVSLDTTVRFDKGLPMKLNNIFTKNQPLQTRSGTPGMRWCPPCQRKSNIPLDYQVIIDKFPPTPPRRQSDGAEVESSVKWGRVRESARRVSPSQ